MKTAVSRGEYDGHGQGLFIFIHDLGKQQADWAVELLVAYLVDRPGAMNLDSSGRVTALQLRDHSAIELVSEAASGAPAAFAQVFIPYMQRVMRLTAIGEGDGPIR